MHKRPVAGNNRHQSKEWAQRRSTTGVYLQESTTGVFQMRINFNGYKAFPSDPTEKAGWHFDGRANIEVLEREIAARIERNHHRPGWW